MNKISRETFVGYTLSHEIVSCNDDGKNKSLWLVMDIKTSEHGFNLKNKGQWTYFATLDEGIEAYNKI